MLAHFDPVCTYSGPQKGDGREQQAPDSHLCPIYNETNKQNDLYHRLMHTSLLKCILYFTSQGCCRRRLPVNLLPGWVLHHNYFWKCRINVS